jgi:hypothetical protein
MVLERWGGWALWDGGGSGGGIGLFVVGDAQIKCQQMPMFALSVQPTAGLVNISLLFCNSPMIQLLECSLVYAHDLLWS